MTEEAEGAGVRFRAGILAALKALILDRLELARRRDV